MMKVHNRPKPRKHEDLKEAVNNYYSVDLPRKAPLTVSSTNCVQIAGRGKKKMMDKYEKLHKSLNAHLQSFKSATVKIHAMTDEYYTIIAKMVEEERLLMNGILESEIKNYIQVL